MKKIAQILPNLKFRFVWIVFLFLVMLINAMQNQISTLSINQMTELITDDRRVLPLLLLGLILSPILLWLFQDRKKTISELILTQKKFEALMQSSSTGVIVASWEGEVLEVNSVFLKMLGYSTSELIGESKQINMASLEDQLIDEKLISDLQTWGTIHSIEKTLYHKDRTPVPVILSGNELDSGKAKQILIRVKDLTEQKKEIERERLLQYREEFLAILSHDLKNPLCAILTCCELMEKYDACSTRPEMAKKLFKTISTSARQMNRLILDLLDLSKIESGKFAINPKVTQIEPIIDEVIGVFQSVADQNKIKLVKSIQQPGLQIKCDQLRMIQVFSNLVGNSIKYAGPGSTITISVETLGKEIQLSVADNGPGISEDQVHHVFDRFWQAKSTAHLGVGLGLSITKGIIDAHGGKIWVESKIGQGSIFTFTLKKALLSEKSLVKIS